MAPGARYQPLVRSSAVARTAERRGWSSAVTWPYWPRSGLPSANDQDHSARGIIRHDHGSSRAPIVSPCVHATGGTITAFPRRS